MHKAKGILTINDGSSAAVSICFALLIGVEVTNSVSPASRTEKRHGC